MSAANSTTASAPPMSGTGKTPFSSEPRQPKAATESEYAKHGRGLVSLLQEAVKGARQEAAENQEPLTGDEEQAKAELEAELEKRVKEAFMFYEERFSTLPSVSRLRELWKERRIDENDPIWLMTDVLALYDARGQIALQQIVRILRACQELNQFTIDEMRAALDTAGRLQLAAAEMNVKVDSVLERMGAFTELMVRYEKQVPVLLNAMYRATSIMDTRSKRAVWELVGIVAGAVAIGTLLGAGLMKVFG